MSNYSTLILYICIIIGSTVLAFASQKISWSSINNKYYCARFSLILFFLSALVAWLFLAFTNIGVDYPNYIYIVRQETWETFSSIYSVEPGFGVLCLLLKFVCGSNSDAVLFFIKSFSVILYFICIFSLRKHISVGYAVFAYMALLYLPSFYLISMMFASSLIMVALTYAYLRKRYIFPMFLIIIAAQIHNSAYLFAAVFALMWIVNKSKKLSKLKKQMIVVGYFIAIVGAGSIYNTASRVISGFHYTRYASGSVGGSGIMIIILYAPLAYICYKLSRHNISNEDRNNIFIFSITSFMFNVLSYRFSVIERMEFYMIPLYCLYIPSVLFSSGVIKHEHKKRYISIEMLVYILYLLFRGYLVFSGRTTEAAGMANYSFFWPF